MQVATLSKRMLLTITALCLVGVAGAALYYRSAACLPFVWGLLLGTAVSLCKVLLLAQTVERAVSMEKKAATGYVFFQNLLRLFLTGAALVVAALVPAIELWGAVAGVLTYQLAVYALKFTASL